MRSSVPRGSVSEATPAVIISLDFELRWGVHDIYGLDFDGYRRNLEQVRHAVPALLDLFEARGIQATWASVGALGCQSWDDYFARAPAPPKYRNSAFRVKPEYADLDPEGTLHFAPELIAQIMTRPGQELGSHTFSHLYLREEGITAEDVAADLAAVSALFSERFGAVPKSLVFPRNQPGFLDVVRASSIRVWRGNPTSWYYESEDSEHHGPLPRALKLIDSINPLTHRAAPPEGDMTRASLFLRLNLPRYLWAAHVARIKAELAQLRPGEIFHLWFHPHNVGPDTQARLARVEEIADAIAELAQSGKLVSRTMGSLVQH
jgi:peptidoglycan/xylan/chitin deacetylase (PgdA/CDA1 family)